MPNSSRTCAEVYAASAREVAISAGDSLSNLSARINRASATALRSDRLRVPSGLGMVVGIPCMANTDTKINKVYMNVITTLAACCG
jgi:hypothetical protein